MSLRAKLEAVIYAAEEPVTLAQLAALFAPELSELASAAAASQAAAVSGPADTLAPLEPIDATATAMEAGHSVAVASVDGSPTSQPAEVANESQPGEAATPASSPAANHPSEPESTAPPTADPARTARQQERAAREQLRTILDGLIREYAEGDRGMEIREVAGGYRMATKPEYHDAVRGFVKSLKPPMKLSLQALETLAVVAYKQPVTAPEISEIRGVESAGTLGSLIAPQAHHHRGTQTGHRPSHPLQNHQGVPAAVRTQGPERAAIDGGVRKDGRRLIRRSRGLRRARSSGH